MLPMFDGIRGESALFRRILLIVPVFLFLTDLAAVQGGEGVRASAKVYMTGDLSRVERVLREGANPNARFKEGFTPLMLACMTARPAIVKLLLDKGAEVNAVTSHGTTALMLASGAGSEEIVRLLLQRRADVHAKESSGWTALTHAAGNGHEKIVKLLSEHGAGK
jgi:ankyrin repeat protein